MDKSVEQVVKDVRICIDEIGLNDALFPSGQDDMEMDTVISSKITDALRYVHGHADLSLLSPDSFLESSSAVIDSSLVCRVSLPSDYMRLVYARLSSWPLALSEPVYWNDAEYAMLCNPYSTGTYERPKLGIRLFPSPVLELYGAKDKDDAVDVAVMLEPSVRDGKIRVSDKLELSLTYYIAGLTLLTYSDNHADDLFNQSMVMMGVSPSVPSSTGGEG